MKNIIITLGCAVLIGGGAALSKDIRVEVSDSNGSWWTAPAVPKFNILISDTLGVANDTSTLTVRITDDKGLRDILLYELTPQLRAGQSTGFELEADVKIPGFYELVIDDDGNRIYSRNFGFEPENIVSLPDSRPDFDSFWDAAVKEIHDLPMEVTVEEITEKSGPSRTLSLVTMTSTDGETLRGYLLMPRAEGSFPVKITYNGYGGRPREYDTEANPELIEYIASTRGQFLCEDINRYGDWIRYGLDAPENFYYRGAYQDVLRAIDYVATLEKADLNRIYAEGGSQGGAFSYIAAALDDRIAAAAPYVPFMSDFPDYLDMAGWPVAGMIQEADKLGKTKEQTLELVSYFDLKNFARRIKCPILMGVGLQDHTCPPHTNFAPYNLLDGSVMKEFVIYPDCGHSVDRPDWDNRVKAFFKDKTRK